MTKFNSKTRGTSFLSNMTSSPIEVGGIPYLNVEAAFQARKNSAKSREFSNLDGFAARKLGRAVHLRPDWPEVKGYIMGEILRLKFAKSTVLGDMLVATGDAYLVEDAPWDAYWGNGKDGKGQNVMGRLLMKIRGEIS
jgi:ribA/ribD-fused uncharacterized protein